MIVVVVENVTLVRDSALDKAEARDIYAALTRDGWRKVPAAEVEECNMSARRMRVQGKRR